MRILEAARRVKSETLRGATWSTHVLAKAVIEDSDEGLITCREAERIANIIRSSNRTMAPLWNLASLIVEACKTGTPPGDTARRMLWYMEDARQRIYHKAMDIVTDGSVLLTLSYSSNVELVLTASNPKMVYVAESLPGGEGVELARHLRTAGKPVALIPDSAIASSVRESDMVLLGADAVTLDPCLYNKLGSLAAAISAKWSGKPVVAVFESYKIHPEARCGEHYIESRSYRVEGWGDVIYKVFDLVHGSLVDAMLTEYGASNFEAGELKSIYARFKEAILQA
ncbi:MAG: hypothetical protein GSR86_02725 [Desulfurococcales archaeon]|nr:hypothetical protein [Desulfurococcales archaeon]